MQLKDILTYHYMSVLFVAELSVEITATPTAKLGALHWYHTHTSWQIMKVQILLIQLHSSLWWKIYLQIPPWLMTNAWLILNISNRKETKVNERYLTSEWTQFITPMNSPWHCSLCMQTHTNTSTTSLE